MHPVWSHVDTICTSGWCYRRQTTADASLRCWLLVLVDRVYDTLVAIFGVGAVGVVK